MISIEEHTSKKMRESIVNFTDFIQSIIFIGSIFNAVIAPVLGRIQKVKLPEFLVKYADIFNIASATYLANCVVMVFFLIKLVVVLIYQNKKRNEEIIHVIDYIHTDYIHNMRDHIHDLEKISLGVDTSKEYERLYNAEYKVLESVAQQCVNQISEIINECMGLPSSGSGSICTCIKMVSFFEKNKPISERNLITLARSKNSSRKRKQTVGENIIGKNTDFLDLSKGYRNYYYGINLKDKLKKGEYNNSTPNFSYESTVVVPIRFSNLHSEIGFIPVSGKKRKLEIKVKSDVDIAGYLCIDTEKVLHEWNNSDEVEKVVKILAFYADSLYIYLSAFQKAFTVTGGRK